MVETSLVKNLVDDGERLIRALDEAKFDIKAAMWFYLGEPDEWRLVIASPKIDDVGPIKAYEAIQDEMKKTLPDSSIALKNIAVVSPQDQTIRLMRIAIRTGPGISGIRFTQNVINNVLIEDAYIYRMT